MTEDTRKTEPRRGRLLIAVIALLAGAVVVLVAGVIFMQEEIRNLRGTVEELKPLQGSNASLQFSERALTLSICQRP